MKHWYIYDASTGIFTGKLVGHASEAAMLRDLPKGHAGFPVNSRADVDPATQRLDVASNTLVAYTPPAPSELESRMQDTAHLAALSGIGNAEGTSIRAHREALLAIGLRLGLLDDPAFKRLSKVDADIVELRKGLRK